MTLMAPPRSLPKPLHIFISFIFIASVEFSGGSSQHFLTSERTTLLNLKQWWGNPPLLRNWNASTSPCNWPEILCNANGSVIILDLMNKGVAGPIPPFICDLHNLFVGKLPDDIDRLSGIEMIELGGNNFTGDIPPAIGNLSALLSLRLYYNLFNGSVPSEIGNLSNLLYFSLSYNKLAAARIPPEFGKLSKLKNLWMEDCNLIEKMPESLGNLSSLESLALNFNNLEGEIPYGLFLLKNLRFLYLYTNNLSGKIPSVMESSNLIGIDVSENRLNGSIPEDFSKLQKLEVLHLFLNQLSGNIPPKVSQIPTLRVFKVFSNNLGGELPSQMGIHSKIEEFDVSGNKLNGKLPENLCGGGTLLTVIVFSNNFTGEVPRSLQSCHKLQSIQLYNNGFTGEFPPEIWNLSNLSTLRINGNFLSGELPSTISMILSRLEISDNKFSGRIPEGISSCTNLHVFKASNNLLSGEISTAITTLSQLFVLHLDGNAFSGELPFEIKSWNSLTTLHLARNKLSGQIPPAISYLQGLLDLDLSENQFSGEIPPPLSRLMLNTLNLSSNKLTGRIPFAFDTVAFENSFLNNPDLCSSSSISNLRTCYTKSSHSHKIFDVILVLLAFITLITILCTLFVFRRHQHIRDLTWKLTSFHKLDFTEATILSGLTENNLIGSGGSGKVYKIKIGDGGVYVAVKTIWNPRKLDHILEKEFLSEVQILGTIRHSNIVKLLCCISSEESKLLVYEYMENQSLDEWLHGKMREPQCLDWPRRLQIAIGVAQGLFYIHHECYPAIIHRDVKSSNILLNSEFKARIADFGVAKILTKSNLGQTNTFSIVAGSFGYFPPEYAYSTRVNERVDVYSFGVVLLELVTGKDPHKIYVDMNLAEWAWRHYSEGNSMVEALDPEINQDNRYMEQIRLVFKLGLICTRALPSSRPSMKDVLGILQRCNQLSEGEKKVLNGKNFDDLDSKM